MAARSQAARPNRRRVYDALSAATKMREDFADRPVERRERFRFGWPLVMKNVGDSLSVAYGSDKWERPNRRGQRKVELYKHLAESRNRALCVPGLLRDERDPNRPWETTGPLVSLDGAPMPRHFAVLGMFEECNLKLYTAGTDRSPRFGRGRDAGVVRIEVRHGMLGGALVQWNQVEPYARERREAELRDEPVVDYDEPFLFVYTPEDGVLVIVVGERLGIARDGIVG